MKKFLPFLFLLLISGPLYAQELVTANKTLKGWILSVDGEPLMINGMNWDYYPIGTNYEFVLWQQSPEFIKKAIDYEMKFLQDIGVNTIRVYTGIPREWITYIYENFGIYTMLNHTFGRYGLTIDGEWKANTEYSDEGVKTLLLAEVTELVKEYKDTKGLLLYLLGNENNYGLFWEGAETEDIPVEDRKSTVRARALYKLFNEAVLEMKSIDKSRPIAICNGDLQFLDIIAEEVPDADIFGTNTYRGATFTDLYDRIADVYDKPVLLTEFGADAFNVKSGSEDQKSQAYFLLWNWKEVYANAAGFGINENSIGGFTFQFSDGWWKFGQTTDLNVHNDHASWSNGGYSFDYEEGSNNMNEEWFGVMAKGKSRDDGTFPLYPRAAYFILQEVHRFNPYATNASIDKLNQHINSVSLNEAVKRAESSSN